MNLETTHQNLGDVAKAVQRRKFIAVNSHIKKTKISNKKTSFIPMDTEEEQTKPKINQRKEIIKIREEINEIKDRKTIEKINKSKSCLLKQNKIDRPLARLNKGGKKREFKLTKF